MIFTLNFQENGDGDLKKSRSSFAKKVTQSTIYVTILLSFNSVGFLVKDISLQIKDLKKEQLKYLEWK